MSSSTFKYISHKDIDKGKWDNLVEKSTNALVFQYSWYLDAYCTWNAIVLNDYDGAIALPTTSKFGITQVYQPNFIQKNNWFGTPISEPQIKEIAQLISAKFSHTHFNTNLLMKENASERINMVLKINDYPTCVKNYSKSLLKNINRNKSKLEIHTEINIPQTVEFYKAAYGKLNPQLKEEDYKTLSGLANSYPRHFVNIHLYNSSVAVASLLFVKGKNRLHYILGAPNDTGRKLNALSVGIDFVIKNYTGKNMILDFEGSMISSVRNFYGSFGAYNEPFFTVQMQSKLLKLLAKGYSKLVKS